MSSQLLHLNLVSSFTSYWRDTFPTTWSTIYPGMQDDATQYQAWVELDFPWVTDRKRRTSGLQFLEMGLDVHCFSRQDEDLARMRVMVDAIRSTLSHQIIAIRDFDLSAQPAVGYAKVSEPEVRDFSRIERSVKGRPLNHSLVSYRCLAQMT
ncbi:MAG: hypothetical protein JKY95_07775 [Planctomycetaceae bacterium]|nr:hypothetical protein [Planctomycetaceae bacterium]